MIDDLENRLKGLMEKKRSKANSFKCDPFYLAKYRFVVKVYLFGKNGNSSNVTVSLSLVKGEYDGVLAWPICHKKIKISLLSQDKDLYVFENNDHQITCNLTIGFPLTAESFTDVNNFISRSDFLGAKFVKDNKVYLKIELT